MVEQIFLSLKVKRSVIIGNQLVYKNNLGVAERLKTQDLRKFINFKKISKLHRIIA